MATWAANLYHLYTTLQPPDNLPPGISWLHPQQQAEVLQLVHRFLYNYFNDENSRTLLLGINPGRLGAGQTGINFTAPKQLLHYCGIKHFFKNNTELSAEFIYSVIEQYGGVENFYKHFFIGSVCPLGFIKNGKNINYYDDKQLQAIVEPFIIDHIFQLVSFNTNTATAICIGEKNFTYLSSLNNRYKWFKNLITVPHPRFVMQYKLKQKQLYIEAYITAFATATALQQQ